MEAPLVCAFSYNLFLRKTSTDAARSAAMYASVDQTVTARSAGAAPPETSAAFFAASVAGSNRPTAGKLIKTSRTMSMPVVSRSPP